MKSFFKKIILLVIFLFFPLFSLSASAPGDLIKAKNFSTVYYYGPDNKRHAFPNETTYNSWYEDFSKVKIVSDSELSSLSLGKNITIRPCTVLIKQSLKDTVYVVGRQGSLYAIDSEARAITLFGKNWNKRVVIIPDHFWSDYKISSTISSDYYPDGCLVKHTNDSSVYLIYQNQKKKVTSPQVFLTNRFQWRNIFTLPSSVFPAQVKDIVQEEKYLTDTSQQTEWPIENIVKIEENIKPLEQNKSVAAPQKPSPSFAVGTYLICEQWQGACDYQKGVEKIKSIGGSFVVLPVGDSLMNYFSKILPKHDWMKTELAKQALDYAHSQGLKVYAWWGMPHEYFLKKYPDWSIRFSDGGTVLDGLNYKYVPPSRVLSSPEYLNVLKAVIKELADMGFDGIDINDNFHFIYDSSFDDFTVNKFQQEKGIIILGNTIPERAKYIKNNQEINKIWQAWRAEQNNKLLALLQQDVDQANPNISFRPHIISHKWTYWDNGLDYTQIAKIVDIPYLMLPFDNQEQINWTIGEMKKNGAKDVVTAFYLYDINPGDEKKFGQGIKWAKEAGVSEAAIFTYELAEKKGLWPTLLKAVEFANQ